ncbi:MAG: hypothetical protein HPY50_13495 [Firmicutes bacterium]|nr:hypothetical protein [Bacillota bacterium]
MFCERCQKRPATVHITKVLDQQKTEEHLCEVCAGEQTEWGFAAAPSFSPIQQFFFSLMNQPDSVQGKMKASPVDSIKCERCGTGYSEFTKEGKFGCVECYQSFNDQLEHLLRRIHGNSRHFGKVPRRGGRAISEKRQLNDLRTELKNAIKKEEFERAAMLRDRIREMEERAGV